MRGHSLQNEVDNDSDSAYIWWRMAPHATLARPYPDLATWRTARRLNQRDAAKLLGISQASYSRFERRVRGAKGQLAKNLMIKTGVPLEVLAGIV